MSMNERAASRPRNESSEGDETAGEAGGVAKRARLATSTPVSIAESPGDSSSSSTATSSHGGSSKSTATSTSNGGGSLKHGTAGRPARPGLEDLAERYTLGRILGMGTYGQVHRASDKYTGDTVAMKMIETVSKHRIEYGFPEAVLREIKILRQLRFHVAKPHPNIITLRNIVLHRQKENTICLVMDYMDIDLRVLLAHQQQFLPRRVAQCYLYQLMKAVTFIHENHIIHRDLKPNNIVINSDHQLKVVDWGLARVFRNDRKIRYENRVCTPWYKPPELVLGAERTPDGYGPPIDMWSVGCIFVELLWRQRGSQKLRQTPFDPHVPAPDGSGRRILPPGFTTVKGPTHFTAPSNLWRVITDRLGVPTPTEWPGCDRLKNWAEFSRLGLTATEAASSLAAKRSAFETELRMASMSPDAIDLALRLLEMRPKKRIVARAAMAHKFFHGGVTDPETGRLVQGGAVADPKSLEPWKDLHRAHSERLRKQAAAKKKGGSAEDHWKGSGGEDMLGAD